MMMNIDVFHHDYLEIVAHLEWIIELEYGKLKSEIKGLLLVAFRQNKPLNPKWLACLDRWTMYIYSRVCPAEY